MSDKNLPAVIQEAILSQRIDKSQVNLILPTQTYGEVIGQYEKITLESVSISLNPNDKEVYPLGGKKQFTDVALQKFAMAIRLQLDPRNCSTGEISPTKIQAKQSGFIRTPNGEIFYKTAEKVINLVVLEKEQRLNYTEKAEKGHPDKIKEWGKTKTGKSYPKSFEPWDSDIERNDWIDRQVARAMIQKEKFAHELAETGAQDRLVRKFLALKSGYADEELSKPFVIPRITIDTTKMFRDPELRQSAIANMTKSVAEIFGPVPDYGNGEHQPERNVTPQQEALPEPEAVQGQAEDESQQELAGVQDDDIPWGDEPKKKPTELEILRSWFENRIAEVPAETTKHWIRTTLAGENGQNIEYLEKYKARLEEKLKGEK